MRPGLLRLLKRPSAFSTLDSLASTPVGIEQLESRYRCLRCQSRGIQQESPAKDGSSLRQQRSVNRRPSGPRRAFSFPIYEIAPSGETNCAQSTDRSHNTNTSGTFQCATKALGLQLEKLEFESDVGHANDLGTRLVDFPENRNNFDLWEELLRFRQRHYGDKGTFEIWEGMTVRVDGVHLPTRGARADFFWQSFVNSGLKRELYLRDVVKYAVNLWEQTGDRWPQLYESVVGGLLDRGMMQQAVEFHKLLQRSHLDQPNDLVRILPSAISSSSLPITSGYMILANQEHRRLTSGVKAFQNMCRTTAGHRIYGRVVSTLLHHGFGEDAILMHRFLVDRQDHPQTYEEVQPLLDCARTYGLKQEFERLKAYAEQRFASETPSQDPETPLAQGSSPTTSKDSSSEQKPFRDDLAARLFATRALNFEGVLVGLQMLGVTKIGPRTLREMAVRAHGSHDILDKVKQLRKAGISVADSVFSRLVQKLAFQNRDILLSDLLQSDQHPDVMEDVQVQEALLVSYYRAKDLRQYNMTLAILMEIAPDAPELFDIHFRKHIAAGEWNMASQVVDELVMRSKSLSEESIDFVAAQVLTPRRATHRPPPGPHLSQLDEVLFVFRILQRVVPAGAYVSAAFWVEMLKRLGMGNYWKELRECSHWLVRQYGRPARRDLEPWARSRLSSFTSNTDPQSTVDQSPGILHLIFTPRMQCAIVSWGFQLRLNPRTTSHHVAHRETGEKFIPWVRGILLLRELEHAGLRLHPRWIKKESRRRLAMLFSQYGPSKRPMNRLVRRENPFSLQRVVGDVSHAWGGPSLFGGMEYSDPQRLVNPPRSPNSFWNASSVRLSRKRRRR